MRQFANILYVSESSTAQAATVARAVSLAENNQADLTIVDVVPVVPADIGVARGGPVSADLQAAMVAERRKSLETLIEPFKQRIDSRLEVLVGQRFLEVIRAVIRNGHDLVMKPAETPKYLERIYGSDDMHLLRKCPCPVWLMHAVEKPDYDCIIAAVDFDPEVPLAANAELNEQIVELASSLALSDFAALHVVHAWDAPAEMMIRTWTDDPEQAVKRYVEGERVRHETALKKLQEWLRNQVGSEAYDHIAPQYHLSRGAAAVVIPDIARRLQSDLVVMGTVGRSGIAGLFIGNTAEAILDQLSCSVLAVKPRGFVSPVQLADA